MSLAAALTGLATTAVSPVWMGNWCRLERVLKHNRKQQPPQLPQASLACLQGLSTSNVHGLCLESLLRQYLLHRERRRAVGYLLMLLRGLNNI